MCYNIRLPTNARRLCQLYKHRSIDLHDLQSCNETMPINTTQTA